MNDPLYIVPFCTMYIRNQERTRLSPFSKVKLCTFDATSCLLENLQKVHKFTLEKGHVCPPLVCKNSTFVPLLFVMYSSRRIRGQTHSLVQNLQR